VVLEAAAQALYAKEIVRTGAIQNSSDYWYWVKSDGRPFTARIVDRGTIELDCGGSAEVFLSDEMVDLDGVVKIVHGDKVLWEGKVERRLDFVLKHIRDTGDRGRIFAASVTVE
jgi:hypothetical protein